MQGTWWRNAKQLDDDQQGIIALGLAQSHLVLGPPGSGKTNLLLLRADYIARAGKKNILVLVFTRTLQQFIIAGIKQYKFVFDPSKVLTCGAWERDFLYQYGITVTPPSDFLEQRLFLLSQVTEVIAKRKLSSVYDAILLDEAHDYLPDEILMFRKIAPVLFAVADPRQKIYKGPDSIETLKSVVNKVHTLHYHYRVGRRICQLADNIAKDSEDYEPLTPTSNYDEKTNPSAVEPVQTEDLSTGSRP